MNSQYYKDRSKVEKQAKEQDEWLTEKLNVHKGQRIVIFQHIPWFLKDINENDEYFNIEKNLRIQMLEKLHASGNFIIFNKLIFYLITRI